MKIIPLTRGLQTTVDDDVYEWASRYTWRAAPSGKPGNKCLFYACRNGRATEGENPDANISLHRVIAGASKRTEWVDHINRDTLDNRKENLRVLSAFENAWNRGTRCDKTTSKHKGVSKNRDGRARPWVAQVMLHGKLSQTYHATEEAAYAWVQEQRNELHKEFACHD